MAGSHRSYSSGSLFSSSAFPVLFFGLGLFNCFYFLSSRSDLFSGLAEATWLLPFFSCFLGALPSCPGDFSSPQPCYYAALVNCGHPFGLGWLLSTYSHTQEAFPVFVSLFTYPG